MIYYKADENNKVSMFTKSEQTAREYNLPSQCADNGLEQAYNGSWYVKGYAPSKPTPTLEERLAKLEAQTGMVRWQREGILAQGSNYSTYIKTKAQEIEDLAQELRGLQ